jgi:pyruvate/2-oxoglutarate/acetoin dehydrogenase E1 component
LTYLDNLTAAMTMLGERPRAVLLGQAVAVPGTGMTQTFAGVPREKLIELPVFEETQLGMAIGLSLDGSHPVVCVYPRINFLLLAVNQLVNHLDAIPRYSDYKPRVIIRTAVATPEPLNPGVQHLDDFSSALRSMLTVVRVDRLMFADQIMPAYRDALERDGSSLIVEFTERYDSV